MSSFRRHVFLSCSNAFSAHAVCGSRGAFVIVVADQLVDVFDQSMVDVEKRKSEKRWPTLGLAAVMAAFIQVSRIHSEGFLRCQFLFADVLQLPPLSFQHHGRHIRSMLFVGTPCPS